MPDPEHSTWYLEIMFDRPYSGIETGPGWARVPFFGREPAEHAERGIRTRIIAEHPVVTGQVLSDRHAIMGSTDKGDGDADAAQI